MVFYRGLELFFNYKQRLITYFMKFLVKQFIVDRRVKLISSRLLLNFRFIKNVSKQINCKIFNELFLSMPQM
jgi:hypothetical protein